VRRLVNETTNHDAPKRSTLAGSGARALNDGDAVMAYDEPEDIEACAREGRAPRKNGPYAVKIAGPDTDEFERYLIDDPVATGRQFISLTGAKPVDEYLIFLILNDGGFEELRLDETVDLRTRGVERFIVFESAASYRFVIDGERYEWGTKIATGLKLKEIGDVDRETNDLWREVRGGEDILIADDTLVDLSEPSLERFFTKEKSPASISIVINARPKTIETNELCFVDLIALAFETPPQGDQICFTVTYRKGPADNPEGSLIEDQCLLIIEGMIFNVTSTDKS